MLTRDGVAGEVVGVVSSFNEGKIVAEYFSWFDFRFSVCTADELKLRGWLAGAGLDDGGDASPTGSDSGD